MLLVEIGRGQFWTVLAICEPNGSCPTLDMVAALEAKRQRKVLSDLQQYVPHSQPADWVRTDFSKKLNGVEDILEFCWSTRRGGTPRVFWFYDRNRVIVCTHGIDKKGKLSLAEIAQAAALKARYDAAVAARDIQIVSCDEFIEREER